MIALGCDHGGYELKLEIIKYLEKNNLEYKDFGCNGESCDYPIYARKVGQAAAGGLGGFALAMTGYNESVQVQSREVVDGIYNVATLYPGILYIAVGLVLMFVYPLGKKCVEENVKTLKVKREMKNKES